MTDRIAALAKALRAIHPGPAPWPGAMTSDEMAAAVIAVLPPDWCGHDPGLFPFAGRFAALEAEIARLRKIEEAARESIAAIDADLYREGTPEDWWKREAALAALRAALEDER